ncbi:hypothetical protein SLA2020_285370 [Shorea laevis]
MASESSRPKKTPVRSKTKATKNKGKRLANASPPDLIAEQQAILDMKFVNSATQKIYEARFATQKRNGQSIEFWDAHKAPIQAVIKLPSGELVTGSSDATLKVWRGKTCIHTFVGHTDTVRGLEVMSGFGILSASHDGSISGSEDCSAKIWKDGVCVQSIEHPGCVWDVKFLDNGDIVTACSDGVLRIWTVHQDKISDSVELESYASQISQYKLSRKKVGGLKLDDLPGLEALQVPAVILIVLFPTNIKIGEVVDGPDDNMKRPVLDGIEYDYVFDVDIGDGELICKLPYNRSDNPYATADKWLLKENLPLSYRQQIVEFILQNSGQKDFTLNSSFRDPFTGANAYIPGEPSNMSVASSKPTFKHIPKKGVLVFDVAQFDGILKKITEFNNSLLSDPEKKNLSLMELELSRLAGAETANSWPLAMIFPVIDILRMTVLHPDGATVLLDHVEAENDVLMEMIKKVTANPAIPGNFLTSIRVVTNLFKNSLLQLILDAFSSCYSSPNKNLQLSYSTLILNYAVLLIEKKDQEGQSQVLSAALEIAEKENLEVDSKFRALVAIGSLMLNGLVKRIYLDFDVETIVV